MAFKRPSNRLSATFYHFLISLLIFIIILTVMIYAWFPGALFQISGGWQGIKIVAGVDLVLGPLMTLVIYNAGKPIKKLFIDLFIICLIQMSCLAIGLHIVYQGRPAIISFVADTFYVYYHNDLQKFDVDYERLNKVQQGWPKIIYLETPEDKTLTQRTLFKQEVMSNKPYGLRQELMQPFTGDATQLRFITNKSKDCELTARIVNSAHKGTICYNSKRKILFNFKPDK